MVPGPLVVAGISIGIHRITRLHELGMRTSKMHRAIAREVFLEIS